MRVVLREQVASHSLEIEDRRDEAYWAIVEPLLQDAERWMSSFHKNDLVVIFGIPKSQ